MSTLTARKIREIAPGGDVGVRLNTLDWEQIANDLDAQGSAVIEKLVTPEECDALAGLYRQDRIFRNRVVMARHGFGRGEYKYFSYPLPDIISELRTFDISKAGADCQSLERSHGNGYALSRETC